MSNFNQKRNDPFETPFLFKLIPWIIGVAFVMIISWWICLAVVAYKGIQEVDQHGIQGLAKQMWCGKTENCDLPAATK